MNIPRSNKLCCQQISYIGLVFNCLLKVKHYLMPLFWLSLLLLTNKTATAQEDSSSTWSLKGFGTFAVTGTDTNKIGFYRDKSQRQDVTNHWSITNDSRLGLQLDWKASDKLQATIQWVARDHIGNFFEQNLDWAFIRWQLPDNLDIRVGRLGSSFALMNDYRNIGYAYPWMRPPHEFYASVPFYHFDGIDIAKKLALSDGYLTIKAFGGHMYNEFLTQSGDLFQEQAPVAGASLRYENDDWQWFLSYAYVRIVSELPTQSVRDLISNPALVRPWPNLKQILPALSIKDNEFHFNDIGFIYDDGVWLSQSELAYMTSQTSWIPPKVQSYFSLGRRFSTLTVYSLFSIVRSFEHPVNVPAPLLANPTLLAHQRRIDKLLNDNSFNEHSVSAGIRWDFYENMALKAQWSHYWLGSKGGVQQWEKPASLTDMPNTVNVMSVGIDFIF